jgi:hypothetical protein
MHDFGYRPSIRAESDAVEVFLAALIAFPAVITTVLLGFCLLYWLTVAFGALDLDLGLDLDTDTPHGGPLELLGIGRVPLGIVLSIYVFCLWFLAMLGQLLMVRHLTGDTAILRTAQPHRPHPAQRAPRFAAGRGAAAAGQLQHTDLALGAVHVTTRILFSLLRHKLFISVIWLNHNANLTSRNDASTGNNNMSLAILNAELPSWRLISPSWP